MMHKAKLGGEFMTSDKKKIEGILDKHQKYLDSIRKGIFDGVSDGIEEGVVKGLEKAAWDVLKKECLPQGLMNIGGIEIEDIGRHISKLALSRNITKATEEVIESNIKAYLDRLSRDIIVEFRGEIPALDVMVELITQRQEKIGQWIGGKLPNNPLSNGIKKGLRTALGEGLDKSIQIFETKFQEKMEGGAKGQGEEPQDLKRETNLDQIEKDIKVPIKDSVAKIVEEAIYDIAKHIIKRAIANLNKELKMKFIRGLEKVLEKKTEQQLKESLTESLNLLKEEINKDCAKKTSFVENIDRSFGTSVKNYLSSLVPKFPIVAAVTVSVGILAVGGIVYGVLSGNEPPVAVASVHWIEGMTVSLSSEGSYDPDGDTVSYHWDFGDGFASEEPNPIHDYREPGDYIVVLTVTDDEGEECSVERTVTVVPPPTHPPVAVASVHWIEGMTVGLSSEGSYDPDGDTVSYHWDFGDGFVSTEPNPVHTYEEAGNYRAILTVMDSEGAEAEDECDVFIRWNIPPVAVASVHWIEGMTVSLGSEGSYDPDGDTVSYHWDFGDGFASTEPNPVHTYEEAGNYKAILTVIDSEGARDVESTREFNIPELPAIHMIAAQAIMTKDTPTHKALVEFCETVTRRTNDKVTWDIFGPEIGEWGDLEYMVAKGTVDLALKPHNPGNDPRWNITSLPFLAPSFEEAAEVTSPGGVLEQLGKQWAPDINQYYLAPFVNSIGLLALNTEPIMTLKQAIGVKIKYGPTPGSACYVAKMGFTPVAIPLGEVYTAVMTGIVDGWVGSGSVDHYTLFRDVAGTQMKTFDFMEIWGISMNLNAWNRLPEEYKDIFQEEAHRISVKRLGQLEDEENEYSQKLIDYGWTVVDMPKDYPDELARWAELARECWVDLEPLIGKVWIDQVRAAIGIPVE